VNVYEFDNQNYDGLGLGMTYDNLKYLDINEVKATVLTQGDMHWDGISAGYEVPKGSRINSDFAAALWIGGLDNSGPLHQAAMTYRQNGYDYWPGPLDTITGTTDTATANAFDKIWKIDRFKIAEFIHYFGTGAVASGAYIPDDDIITWPAKGNGNYTREMAPFVDVNHNGIYDPMTGGDYPVIQGDEMLYRIFNDNLAPHTESGGQPLKVEVHASAWAYACSSIADSNKALNYTTYYSYQIFNRSHQDYHKVILGHWQDPDLGLYSDDYVGCYPKGNYGYVYNGNACDGPGSIGAYGCNPPMMSTVVLDGPLAVPGDGIDNNNNGIIDEPGEKNLMTGFLYYNNDFNPANGNPKTKDPYSYYNYLSSHWMDSTHMTYGGNGMATGAPTNFMWPDFGYDTTGWSEKTIHNTPGDRRFLMSCGPFDLLADSSVHFELAYVWSRDTSLVNGSQPFFDNNLRDVQRTQYWQAHQNAPSCLAMNVGIEEKVLPEGMMQAYPNPATETLYLSFTEEMKNAKATLFDYTGRLNGSWNFTGTSFQVSLDGLAEGIYLIKVEEQGKIYVRKFVKK
jgi:hypothetical protein